MILLGRENRCRGWFRLGRENDVDADACIRVPWNSTADDVLDPNSIVGKQSIRFAGPSSPAAGNDNTLYIPPPWKRDKGIFNHLMPFPLSN